MKKILILLCVAGLFNACATPSGTETGNDSTNVDSTIVTDSIPVDTVADHESDTTATPVDTTTSTEVGQ